MLEDEAEEAPRREGPLAAEKGEVERCLRIGRRWVERHGVAVMANLRQGDGRVLWRRVYAVRPRLAVDVSRRAIAADSESTWPLTV